MPRLIDAIVVSRLPGDCRQACSAMQAVEQLLRSARTFSLVHVVGQ
jgi:hypothetical protein